MYSGVGYAYTTHAYQETTRKEIMRLDLGLETLPSSEKDAKSFWNVLQDIIVDVGRSAKSPLTDVLLLGEDAGNPDLIDAIKDALKQLVPHRLNDIRISSLGGAEEFAPVYVAARGAAEFAKRAQEAPPNCRKPPRCARNRLSETGFQDHQVVLNIEL